MESGPVAGGSPSPTSERRRSCDRLEGGSGDGTGRPAADPAPEHKRERLAEQPACTRNTASPGSTGPATPPSPAAQSSRDPKHSSSGGVTNAGFLEDPPPYSPPDPKTAHLLYSPFQAGFSGQVPIVYQPAPSRQTLYPQQNLASGSFPYTIYNVPPDSRLPTGAAGICVPKDYLVESVLVMVFCCFLTGVIALVYSHETRAALNRGDLIQANAASNKARLLVLFSLLFGVFVSVSWIVYVVVTLYV
uniref:Proline rich transmembrane protein 1B n=1 Tax=Sphenodon punctatus TaxID=8508 RepID=A0A8D0HE06_SPHPU